MQLHICAYIHYYIQVNQLRCFRYVFIVCVCACVCVPVCACVCVRVRVSVCELLTWINILRNPNIPCESSSSR